MTTKESKIGTVEFVQLRKKFKDVTIVTTKDEIVMVDDNNEEHVVSGRKTISFKITFPNFFKKQMLFTQEKGLNHYLYITIDGVKCATNAIIVLMEFPENSETFTARFMVTTRMMVI